MRNHVLTLARTLAVSGVFGSGVGLLSAQSTSVLNLGTVPATQVADGLGFNIQPEQDWQWAAIAAAGGTHARIQCSWAGVEQQTAPPNNTQASTHYIEDPNCVLGFTSAAKYGIHPTVVAGYGAPFHQILTVTLPHAVAAGSYTMDVEFSAGVGGDTLANIKFPYDYICPFQAMSGSSLAQCKGQISNRFAAPGALITAVKLTDATHATLTLASSLAATLPAGSTPYMINEILYPSTASQDPSDPSVNAYGNYVSFLAQDMASRGVTGDIEIWNEPPWKNDPWDYRAGMYDSGTYPGPAVSGANFGFAANIQHRIFPEGITATWNGTSGSGGTSLLSGNMQQQSGEALLQPSTVITRESFHPYGGQYSDPEVVIMNPACLEAAASSTLPWLKNIFANGRNCYLPGEPQDGNLFQAVEFDDIAKLTNPSYGIGHSVTETNNLPPSGGYDIQQARSNVRQFLGFEAAGVTPVEFYKLWDGNTLGRSFTFVTYDGTSFTPRQSYTALAGLMTDIDGIDNNAVTAISATTLPSVVSYSGKYALATATVTGARDGASANSAALFVWQLSACTTSGGCWYSLSVGAGGPVTVSIPSGMKVTAVRNTTTRVDVAYTTSGSQISFTATDDPIEVMTDPTSATEPGDGGPFLQQTTLALNANPTTSSYGSQVLLSAALSPSSSKSANTNGEAVTFYDGSTLIGTTQLASGVATMDITSLSVGTHILSAAFAGDKNFGGSTTKRSFQVVPAVSAITIAPVADVTYGVATVNVTASSNSTGQMHYAVTGPARINSYSSTGTQLVILGAGSVTLTITQEAVTGHAAATASISFNVNPATPTLTMRPVGDKPYGAGAFACAIDSNSKGAITYSVLHGPVTISGNIGTITGAGSVTLQATQAATANYTAATATTSFTVNPATPQISMQYIQPRSLGAAPFSPVATSNAPGAITYSIVSGSATVSGNTITLTGAGVVTVQASQAATANFAAASVQGSFTVSQGTPYLKINTIANRPFTSTPIPVSTTSASDAPVTFTLVSGPATLSGDAITPTGPGFVIIQASQAATKNYVAAVTRTGFSVTTATANLQLEPVADKTILDAPFSIRATSNSLAPITYKIVSGPAVISANVITLQGTGTVLLQASQGAYDKYPPAVVNQAFLVIPPGVGVQ